MVENLLKIIDLKTLRKKNMIQFSSPYQRARHSQKKAENIKVKRNPCLINCECKRYTKLK